MMGGDRDIVLNIGRKEGDPELGEAGNSKIPVFIQKRGEPRRKTFVEAKGEVTKLRVLLVSHIESSHEWEDGQGEEGPQQEQPQCPPVLKFHLWKGGLNCLG